MSTIPDVTQLLLRLGKGTPEEALSALRTSPEGLEEPEARTRSRQVGRNEVAREKPPTWWVQLVRAFINPFSLILVVLGVTSWVTDVLLADPGEATWAKVAIIASMIAISGVIQFWQEFRSRRAAEKLKALVWSTAAVLRRDPAAPSKPREIPFAEIVPGDIVYLDAGDLVPADLRLLKAQDLFVNESALTGEAMPVEKFAIPVTAEEAREARRDRETGNPLELNTLCFLGSNVVSGSAVGVVITTGDRTYFGALAKSVAGRRVLTSFDIGIKKVSWLLIWFIVAMAPAVFLLNGLTKHDWYAAFLFTVAVAVGLLPEMLPVIVATNLAKGAGNMAKQKVVVKKLNAIQNFGAMDVLCSDKTGTLTENRVVLVRHLDPAGRESDRVLALAYLNSSLQTGLENLMDQAIVERPPEDPGQVSGYRKVDEIPFDFARRRMSVVIEREPDPRQLICKGAVEEVLELCTTVEDDGKAVLFPSELRQRVGNLVADLNRDGMRVIAVARSEVPRKAQDNYRAEDEQQLTLVGFVAFLDPPKESAGQAVALLAEHGVTVKVITGDNEIVTERICREVNLGSGRTLLGSEIARLSDERLMSLVGDTMIFAKVDPMQKARIIRALRSAGHTVGYLGDGINDAAALREADVGISVDRAVDIAKESADIILLQQDLHVLQRGVAEGRTVFGNIMKYIKMTASSNFGNVFSVLIASAFLPFLPMLAIQLLLQNLLYDISQLAIPWDRMDPEFLAKPRKWEARGIARFMLAIGPISSVFDIVTFLVLWFVFKANSPAVQSLFQSGWFVEGLLSQTLIVHMIRTSRLPFVQSRASVPVLLLTGAVIAVGILVPFSPIGRSVGLQALPSGFFPLLALILAGYGLLTELAKRVYIRRYGAWL